MHLLYFSLFCFILCYYRTSFMCNKCFILFHCSNSTRNHTITTLKFHTRSISYWHCHRICSKYPPLTCMRAPRCVCQSLIAGRVLYLSTRERCHIQSPRHRLVSGADNIAVQFTSPYQTDQTLIQWTTVSVASPNSMPTSPVCSKCWWTEPASVKRLVRRGSEYHWQHKN